MTALADNRPAKKTEKRISLGDDAIETPATDWFHFATSAATLVKQLHQISRSSGVCCGIVGPWGSGKSSFMKLMAGNARKKYRNACVSWFTAWDPGGIPDIGDAMLYRLFYDLEKENKELSDAFKELQEALRLRRSIRDRARQALSIASRVLPEQGRIVADAAAGLLEELDTPRRVHDSFDKLVEWLEKTNKIVFFFVDDLDRASGEQIRDLFSELKVYVSHRRIVSVLAYDEEYVLKALSPPVLAEGIVPREYLEKIVTVRPGLPYPEIDDLNRYAMKLIQSIPQVAEDQRGYAANFAVALSLGNPRRIKSLVVAFANSLPLVDLQEGPIPITTLISCLIATAMSGMGFLVDDDIASQLEEGSEEGITSAIQKFVEKHPEKIKEAQAVIKTIETMTPSFTTSTPTALRLRLTPLILEPGRVGADRTKRELSRAVLFDWSVSLSSLLSKASARGFEISSDLADGSRQMVVPSGTECRSIKFSEIDLSAYGPVPTYFADLPVYMLESGEARMAIIIPSRLSPRDPELLARTTLFDDILRRIFDGCQGLVSDKEFALWIIDDVEIMRHSRLGPDVLKKEARKRSEGLKHPLTFLYTELEKLPDLLSFLLNAASG